MSRTQKTLDEFRRDLKKLPQQVRTKRIRAILRREALVIRNEMRVLAEVESGYYKTRQGRRVNKKGIKLSEVKRGNVKTGGYTTFLGLSDSINRFSNRRNRDYMYEVVGTLGTNKGGAYYAQWQNFGDSIFRVNYKGKRFVEKTKVRQSQIAGKIDKEIRKALNKTFVVR